VRNRPARGCETSGAQAAEQQPQEGGRNRRALWAERPRAVQVQ